VPQEVLHLHPALDLSLKQVSLELDWLDAKLGELGKRAQENYAPKKSALS